MAAHFLLSPAAKTINLVRVARMSKEEAETTFAAIRWAATNGKPVCPHCGCLNAYECRRPNGAPRFRCRAKECARDFSLTSGTLFAFHKMPLQTYLLAIAIFVNEVKGKTARRSPSPHQPERQAASRHHHPRAQRQQRPGRLQVGERGARLRQGSHRQGHRAPCRRLALVG